MNNENVERVVASRLLRSSAEIAEFQEALDILAEHVDEMSDLELQRLYTAFDDETASVDVMFSLVHVIESLPVDRDIRITLRSLPHLGHAKKWSEMLVARLIKGKDEVEFMLSHLAAASKEEKNAVKSIVANMVSDNRLDEDLGNELIATCDS